MGEENVGEKNEDKESDEPDFCLMTDKPQEVLNAVPTLENTLGLAGADEKLCRDASSSSEDEEEGSKIDQDSDEDPAEADNMKEEEKKTDEAEIGDNKMDQLSFGIEVQSEMPVAESDVKVNEENLTVEDVNASNKFEGNNSDSASEKDDDDEEEEKKDSSSSEEEEEEKETGPMAAFGPDSGQEAAAGEETVQHPELLEGSATEAKTAAFESDKMGDSIQMEERESDNEDECANEEEEEKCEQKKENVQGDQSNADSSEDEKDNEEEESPDGK